MLEGLDKIKALIAVYAELPRGLTTKLMEFMDPFAGISSLRRRLGQDRDEDTPAAPLSAVAAVAPVAPAAAAPPEQGGDAAAAPKVRRFGTHAASRRTLTVMLCAAACAIACAG